MPRVRKLAAYPPEFWATFTRAMEGEVRFPMSKKSAKLLRFELYGFRTAVLNKLELSPEELSPEQRQVATRLHKVQLCVDDAGLLAKPKNYNYVSMREALTK